MQYEAYCTEPDNLSVNQLNSSSQCGFPYYLREVYANETMQKTHLNTSKALEKWKTFKDNYANFSDPNSKLDVPRAEVTTGVVVYQDAFIRSVVPQSVVVGPIALKKPNVTLEKLLVSTLLEVRDLARLERRAASYDAYRTDRNNRTVVLDN